MLQDFLSANHETRNGFPERSALHWGKRATDLKILNKGSQSFFIEDHYSSSIFRQRTQA
jgi:hypothetical protein